MTQLDLDQIEAREKAATPGPWKIEKDYCDCSEYGCGHPPFAVAFGPFTSFENTSDQHHADAEFAAHARTDVKAMAAEIRLLRDQLAEYEVLNPQQCPAGKHADWLIDSEYAHACPWCEIDRLKPAAEETHVVADDSDDPEHIDDCPGCDGTRPCGHDDYHDAHEWADRPGVWCPGISYADDEPNAARP